MLLRTTTIICLSGLTLAESAATFARISPQYQDAFQHPLPISPVKKPLTSYTNPTTGRTIDFYEVEVKEFKHKFFPNLPGTADLIGYDGSYPGPTFAVEKGRETVVRFVNKASQKMNVHLHGSYSRSPWDGWALDWLEPGQYKDYYYPNAVHRTLWYHDHTNKEGAVNVYKGLVGLYQIVDSKLDASLGLPSGGKYDIPLILTTHYFTRDGGLSNEKSQSTSIYGDTYLVNGQIQPYLAVEPRNYRFRILNAAVSRVFNLTLMVDNVPVPMSIVGSDGGYRQAPVTTKNLMTEMAARWEVVFDFAQYAGKNLTLTTKNAWTDTSYADTDQIMRFVVGKTVSDKTANAPLPRKFAYDMKFPTETKISAERVIKLDSHMDMVWGMNGIHHDDAMSRVMMRPPLGTMEKYTFKSTGMGMTTGGRTGSADPSLNPAAAGTSGGGMAGHHGGGSSMAPAPGASNSGMGGGNMAGHHGGGSSMSPVSTPSTSGAGHSGMGGMNMGSHHGGRSIKTDISLEGSPSGVKITKRQMMGMGDAAWTHAMHVHLVDMKIISRRKDVPSKPEGRDYLEEYEKDSIKDVVLLGSNEVVEVLAKFVPYPGVYMFHCHNSVHSDQGMMGVINVTRLQDFGYKELKARLEDPMDARFRAKPYTSTNLEEIKLKTLPYFASLGAYPDPAALSAVEERYWSTRTPPAASDTGPLTPIIPGMEGMSGGMASHHRGESPPAPSKASTSSTSAATGSMTGGMGGDMASHHGGTGMKAVPSAANSSPAAMGGMGEMGGMAGMHGHHP